MSIQLQKSLFTDAPNFVAVLHGKSRHSKVYVCQNRDKWYQQALNIEQAIVYANELANVDAKDCYVSANGFGWKDHKRTVSNVESINCFFVDFDRYKTEYKDLTAEQFLDTVLTDNPQLPAPTLFMDSGNGCWMFWLLKRSLGAKSQKVDWIPQWQTCQDLMISGLKQYGADPACSDLSRVVRITDTWNSKTDKRASAWVTATDYDFGWFKKTIKEQFGKPALHPETKEQAHNRKPASAQKKGKRKVSSLLTWHSLAYARMSDLKKLADLRGGRYVKDHKRMSAWFYAVSAAHFCRAEDSLRSEVDQFIEQYLDDPNKHHKSINYESTVNRMLEEERLIASGMDRRTAHQQLKSESKGRYDLRTQTIVDALEITQFEQRRLATLIGAEEKLRRKADANREKRRSAGAEMRSDYEGKTGQKRLAMEQAKALYEIHHSVRKVAEEMGLTRSTAHRYINGK